MTAPTPLSLARRSQIELPPGIVLPYYARPDLASLETVTMGFGGGVNSFASTTNTGNLEIPVAIYVSGQTSVVAGNRYAHMHITHGFYSNYIFVPAAAIIPETTIYTLFFSNTINSAWSGRAQLTSSTSFKQEMAMPLPAILLNPGDVVTVNVLNGDVGDTVLDAQYTRIVIPNGPPLTYEFPAAAPRATPII